MDTRVTDTAAPSTVVDEPNEDPEDCSDEEPPFPLYGLFGYADQLD